MPFSILDQPKRGEWTRPPSLPAGTADAIPLLSGKGPRDSDSMPRKGVGPPAKCSPATADTHFLEGRLAVVSTLHPPRQGEKLYYADKLLVRTLAFAASVEKEQITLAGAVCSVGSLILSQLAACECRRDVRTLQIGEALQPPPVLRLF